jgi:Leucine-rich repeat (LRR) protein
MAASITSITGLQNLTNLQQFRADWNSLSTVNVSGLSNLTYLDLSDNETLDTENKSLTSVILTGCTALEELRLDDSNFSAGTPDLTGLTSLFWLDMDQCDITGNVDLSMLPALSGFDLSSNTGLTSVTIFEQVLNDVNLYNCALTEASVNDILGWLDGGGETNGYVDLEGGTNAAPSGDGLTALTNLQGKGWNVYVNTPPTTTTTTTTV